MVSSGGRLYDTSAVSRAGHMLKGESARILATVLVVIGIGMALVISGNSNEQAIELLSNHHDETQAVKDAGRLEELSRLAAAADSAATQAAALKTTEANKLLVTPDSKVDAEMMLSREAAKKAATLTDKVSKIGSKLRVLRKTLRRDNHASRQEGRLLHKVQGNLRDSMLNLHDKEMKVLEARHDVQNTAKAGDVAALRDAQKLLANRKAIAKGARAEYDEKKKLRDQVAKKAHLLQTRAQDVVEAMEQLRAEAHNDKLKAKEETSASSAIKARANYLRDRAALKSAQTKYSTLAQLLADPSTDHTQVEETLSKIAANIHSWKELKGADEKDMAHKVAQYKRARTRLAAKSVALASVASDAKVRVSADTAEKAYRDSGLPTLLETGFSFGDGSWSAPAAGTTELQQQPAQAYAAPAAAAYPYAAPPQGYSYAQTPGLVPVSQQQALEGVPLSEVQAGAQQFAQPPAQYPPQAVPPPQQYAQQPPPAPPTALSAPAPQAAVLPGAVGNIPYVYNDRQFLPSPLPAGSKFPITWLFADNKTPDPLYFGFQSSDGVMHVYNEINPHSVTRQQAFGNEYWTILGADKRTVAVQPFKITQNNQWLSIAPAPQQ